MTQTLTDLFIIGGGINGTGIAADASGRGLSVVLCEQADLANATSSASSKLIHGGLRYLEYYEFRLVREALAEREILLKKAPHIIKPLRFIMPHDKSLRPAWMIRLGLFLYDHLGKRKLLPKSASLDLTCDLSEQPLKPEFIKGFAYSDCWVDDARLVVLNAMQAKKQGAAILTRTQCLSAVREKDGWQITLRNTLTNELSHIRSKALINAAGPWVEDVLKNTINIAGKNRVSLIKGSHIIVPKLYQHDAAYILQNTDKRIIFVIPYLHNFSLIGTTDLAYKGNPQTVTISSSEIEYLCAAVNRYFARAIQPADVVNSYAGVRPLHSDDAENPSAITRDYTLELDQSIDTAPLLSIFGGKITTYRKLAEHALILLKPFFPQIKPSRTANHPLPGGDIENADFAKFLHNFQQQYAWLPINLTSRYAHSYGTLAKLILKDAKNLTDLGQHFGAGLYQNEIDYLIENEWVSTSEDILWRRSKLGYQLIHAEVEALTNYLLNRQTAN